MNTLAQTQKWADNLTKMESRGNGDQDNAWKRLAQRYGLSKYTFWSLKYRPPKDVEANVWLRIGAAYMAECERQMRKLQHEIDITRRITGPDHPYLGKAQTLVDKD